VRDSSYKLIVNNYGTSTQDFELYNLSSDRWESNDRLDGMVALISDLDRASTLYRKAGNIIAAH
jgi:hypothetical protein